MSIIPFNGSITRAFVFLINKLDPSCCFYGVDKYLCSQAAAPHWSKALSERLAEFLVPEIRITGVLQCGWAGDGCF